EVEGMPRPVEPLGVSKPSPVTYVRTVKPAGTRMSARAADDSRRGRARASTAPRLEVRERILRRILPEGDGEVNPPALAHARCYTPARESSERPRWIRVRPVPTP